MSSLKDREESPRWTPEQKYEIRDWLIMSFVLGMVATIPVGIGLALYTDHAYWLVLCLFGVLILAS